ncbi:MAG: hypothetical protein M5R36_27290 [Deltaproteobacteria bacterium]|nr:hypothetical protein [Deltaproteobacteria bacterium]
MTRICTTCLTLHENVDHCPSCGQGLVPLEFWRRHRFEMEGPAPPAPAPVKDDADDGSTRFVLGIFLSCLAFFIGFLMAYVATVWTG